MNTLNFGKNILNQAQTQLITSAILLGEEKGKKKITAILKARIELQINRTIRFDSEFGILKFTSAQSKRPRIVTASGCSDQCECKNNISYHSALFELIEKSIEIQAENVITFPVKRCFLCNEPSATDIHYNCHRAEEYAAEMQAA